jgi:hypothetical protein
MTSTTPTRHIVITSRRTGVILLVLAVSLGLGGAPLLARAGQDHQVATRQSMPSEPVGPRDVTPGDLSAAPTLEQLAARAHEIAERYLQGRASLADVTQAEKQFGRVWLLTHR